MVVGLIQLAHKMSRAPAHASSTPPPRLPVPFFATLSLFSALSLSLSVYFRSQMWHGLNLGFTSASDSFVCRCQLPLAIVLFIMYLFHFYILTFSFVLSLIFSFFASVSPLSWPIKWAPGRGGADVCDGIKMKLAMHIFSLNCVYNSLVYNSITV